MNNLLYAQYLQESGVYYGPMEAVHDLTQAQRTYVTLVRTRKATQQQSYRVATVANAVSLAQQIELYDLARETLERTGVVETQQVPLLKNNTLARTKMGTINMLTCHEV